MKLSLLSICLAGLTLGYADLDLTREWKEFKDKYEKKYSPAEEPQKFMTYYANRLEHEKHNAEAAAGKHSFFMGPNEYSDLSIEEIKQTMNGYKGIEGRPLSGEPFVPSTTAVPDTVDWRQKGVVTPVKNQGQCGSCWAFSSTGSMEAANAQKTGKLVSLSEQNLVDCCTGKYGNSGCGGGWMDNAFKYVQAVNGIDTEKYYPYLGEDWYCFFSDSPQAVGGDNVGHVDIPKGNETALKIAVATVGPVSIAIDAAHSSFSGYKSGVYYEPSCSSVNLDHAVLVVGYGTENGQDYWLVKNSWGSSWGDEGYIKMARNRDNNCGIVTAASYPLA